MEAVEKREIGVRRPAFLRVLPLLLVPRIPLVLRISLAPGLLLTTRFLLGTRVLLRTRFALRTRLARILATSAHRVPPGAFLSRGSFMGNAAMALH
jgi:hypothetical protein